MSAAVFYFITIPASFAIIAIIADTLEMFIW